METETRRLEGWVGRVLGGKGLIDAVQCSVVLCCRSIGRGEE